MAHYRASVETTRPLDEVFAYLSDFSATEEWDPGILDANRVNGAAVARGAFGSPGPPKTAQDLPACHAECFRN